jgi:hypothetical protein
MPSDSSSNFNTKPNNWLISSQRCYNYAERISAAGVKGNIVQIACGVYRI